MSSTNTEEEKIDTGFRVFGFISSEFRRNFIIALLAIQFTAIIYLMIANSNLHKQLSAQQEKQRLGEERLYERIIQQIQPKLLKIDSTNVSVNRNLTRQDSIQNIVVKKITK